MWVLTFEKANGDRRCVMSEVAEFARRIRQASGGDSFAYWYSPELHPGGHLWHVNFFVPDWLSHSTVQRLWGHGIVWVTDFGTASKAPKGEPLGLCRNERDGWRRASQYGCKYAQKDWSRENIDQRNHRYEVAQGFAPEQLSHWVTSREEAARIISGLVPVSGEGLLVKWDSADSEDWDGPPAVTWRW